MSWKTLDFLNYEGAQTLLDTTALPHPDNQPNHQITISDDVLLILPSPCYENHAYFTLLEP
jgi:hypothetical protein